MFLLSCGTKKEQADLIIHNARIYTIDSTFSIAEAMAIKDGKILFTGTNKEVLAKYESNEQKDIQGGVIFPGFIDAHCHFYAYGRGLNEVDLVDTKSYNEVLQKTIVFSKEQHLYPENPNALKNIGTLKENWILGRGWDQNDWEKKEFPDRDKLDSLFPNTPVVLKRIDGHAVLVNKVALDIAGFTLKTKINGGELVTKDGKLTGVLIDNASDSIQKFIPKQNKELIKKALLKAQENCLAMGLTTVDDAGLEKNIVDAIDSLHKSNELKMRIYAMLTPNKENMDYYLKRGAYKTERLTVCSFKFYGDGALGSRGACLLKDYDDKKNWKGFLLNSFEYFNKNAELMNDNNFQMNTHCIGDSAMRLAIMAYALNPLIYYDFDHKLSDKINRDRRWRIEHAQIIDTADLKFIKALHIIPSVQPTHATSDMYWATDRLGPKRIKNAYAYKTLLEAAGMLALGTDFPVEDISPFKTLYAAVARKDARGFPAGGFQKENALSRKEALMGMTIWAAYSNFEEKEKGSLTRGKWADFVILDHDIFTCKEEDILNTRVLSTYIRAEQVYKKN